MEGGPAPVLPEGSGGKWAGAGTVKHSVPWGRCVSARIVSERRVGSSLPSSCGSEVV